MILVPFTFYVGLFNSISSLINQILQPYSFSENDAGYRWALLIVVGLVTSAVTSPIIDKTKSYLLAIKIQVPNRCRLLLSIHLGAPNKKYCGPVRDSLCPRRSIILPGACRFRIPDRIDSPRFARSHEYNMLGRWPTPWRYLYHRLRCPSRSRRKRWNSRQWDPPASRKYVEGIDLADGRGTCSCPTPSCIRLLWQTS